MPEVRVLRYWPWLVMCVAAALVFGAVAGLALAGAVRTESWFLRIVDAALGLATATLAVYAAASLQVRTRLDAQGVTTVWPFSRRRLDWRGIERLDVAHVLPGWTVRGWTENKPVVIFVCHDTHGRRPKVETFDEPPGHVPRKLREGYEEIERRWEQSKYA